MKARTVGGKQSWENGGAGPTKPTWRPRGASHRAAAPQRATNAAGELIKVVEEPPLATSGEATPESACEPPPAGPGELRQLAGCRVAEPSTQSKSECGVAAPSTQSKYRYGMAEPSTKSKYK